MYFDHTHGKCNISNTNKTINGKQARLPAKTLNLCTILSATTVQLSKLLLNITYSIARFWLIQVATPKSASFVVKLNLYTSFNEQFIKWNGNMSFQARLLAKLLENNLLCDPKRLMNCFSQIKITCANVYLLLSLFLALVCLAFWTPTARVIKETTQRVTWNRGKSIKFPPTPPIRCQIPHPNNNHWCQIPAPLGTWTSQMPGVCPGVDVDVSIWSIH